MRLALALVIAAAGCAAETVPAPGSAPVGMKRQEAASNRASLGKHRPRHRRPTSVVSRSLRRSPVAQPWLSLAQCESGGDWHANTGNGFYGGTQTAPSTWAAFGGLRFASRADLASRGEQVTVNERILAAQGWNAWPTCARRLGYIR